MSATQPIPVTGRSGLRGTLDPADLESATENVVIHLEDGRSLLVPRDALVAQPSGGYDLPLSLEQIQAAVDTQAEQVIPVIEERARIKREEAETARVRITKRVHEWEEEVSTPHLLETVDVERVPIDRVIAEPAQPRQEGDTWIIPVMEEVFVLEKRILLKEEVRVTRRREETPDHQRVTLRKEEVQVERNDSPGPPDRED